MIRRTCTFAVAAVLAALTALNASAEQPMLNGDMGKTTKAEVLPAVGYLDLTLGQQKLSYMLNGGYPKPPLKEPVGLQLTPEAIDVVKDLVSQKFFDPFSAQFRDVRAAVNAYDTKHTYFFVCGSVNAKNRFGAYVGFEQFYLVVLNPALGTHDSTTYFASDTSPDYAAATCELAGL